MSNVRRTASLFPFLLSAGLFLAVFTASCSPGSSTGSLSSSGGTSGGSGGGSGSNQNGGGINNPPPSYVLEIGSPVDTAVTNGIAMGTADFNSDGKTDLIVLTSTPDLKLFLGNGNGTFAAATTHTLSAGIGTAQSQILVVDFDADGKSDVIVPGSAELNILFGSGSAFAAPVAYAVSVAAQRIAVGDIDGDGDLDLAYTNSTATAGKVIFRLASNAALGAEVVKNVTTKEPTDLVAADFDGDGLDDVLTLNNGDTDMTFYRSDETSLIDGILTSLAQAPTHVAVKDISGDGNPDLAFVGTTQAYFGLNVGGGAFTISTVGSALAAGAYTAVAFHPSSTNVFGFASVTGGDESLFDYAYNGTSYALDSKEQLGSLSWTKSTILPVDINQNGILDIVCLKGSSNVLAYLGTGSFPNGATVVGYSGGAPSALRCAANVFTMNSKTQYAAGLTAGLGVVADNADGTYTPAAVASLNSQPGLFITPAADLEGDSDQDFVGIADNDVYVFKQNGTSINSTTALDLGAKTPVMAVVGDLDGDANLDIVSVNSGGDVSVLMDHAGAPTHFACGASPVWAQAVNYDGDSDVDVLVYNNNGIELLANNGSGTLAAAASVFGVGAGGTPKFFALIDLTGDGKLDAVGATTTRGWYRIRNSDNSWGSENSLTLADTVVGFGVADLDGNGKSDLVFATDDTGTSGSQGALRIFLGNAQGFFLSGPTVIATCADPVGISLLNFGGSNSKADILVSASDGTLYLVDNASYTVQ